VGFGGHRYRTELVKSEDRGAGGDAAGYADQFDDFLGFLRPRLVEAYRVLTPAGSLSSTSTTARSTTARSCWIQSLAASVSRTRSSGPTTMARAPPSAGPPSTTTILWYTRDPCATPSTWTRAIESPTWRPAWSAPRRPRRGKTPTDVWWHTIVSPPVRRKTGYATQKPLGILERIVRVHSNPGDWCWTLRRQRTTGEAAAKNGRAFCLVDQNPEAIAVMQRRLAKYGPRMEHGASESNSGGGYG